MYNVLDVRGMWILHVSYYPIDRLLIHYWGSKNGRPSMEMFPACLISGRAVWRTMTWYLGSWDGLPVAIALSICGFAMSSTWWAWFKGTFQWISTLYQWHKFLVWFVFLTAVKPVINHPPIGGFLWMIWDHVNRHPEKGGVYHTTLHPQIRDYNWSCGVDLAYIPTGKSTTGIHREYYGIRFTFFGGSLSKS